MLQPVMHILKQKNIVLASGSPRRKELLENIGLKVNVCPSKFEENLDPRTFTFSEFVKETALHKVLEVESRLKAEGQAPDVVIGADTMVVLGERMFGKPTTEDEAFEMLSQLAGRGHTVYTGVVVKSLEKIVKFTEETNVFFGNVSDEQIKGYIATGEPMDKAGGYGVQGVGGTFVERVEVHEVMYRFDSFGIAIGPGMLKHVAVSPHRARADSVSLASSASCCSLGSLEHRHDSVTELSHRTTTIKVFARCLRPDIEYKTLSVTWGTRAREVVATLLGKFRMRHRDPRLFYLSMEVRVRAAGLRTTLVLDDDARPAALQACHPKGYSKFSLQMRPGGLIKIYDSALMSSSQYKCLLTSERTTADEVLAILLHCYDSDEGVERFSLYEVSPSQEYERKLHPDDLPLLEQRAWPPGADRHFRVRRNPRAPPPPPPPLPPPRPLTAPPHAHAHAHAHQHAPADDEPSRALSALSLESDGDGSRYSPVYKYPSISYCRETKNDYLYI